MPSYNNICMCFDGNANYFYHDKCIIKKVKNKTSQKSCFPQIPIM